MTLAGFRRNTKRGLGTGCRSDDVFLVRLGWCIRASHQPESDREGRRIRGNKAKAPFHLTLCLLPLTAALASDAGNRIRYVFERFVCRGDPRTPWCVAMQLAYRDSYSAAYAARDKAMRLYC